MLRREILGREPSESAPSSRVGGQPITPPQSKSPCQPEMTKNKPKSMLQSRAARRNQKSMHATVHPDRLPQNRRHCNYRIRSRHRVTASNALPIAGNIEQTMQNEMFVVDCEHHIAALQ